MMETRRSGREYYGEFEFTIPDHIYFLNQVLKSPAKIMITHPPCDMYSAALVGWNCEKLEYMGHQGPVNDAVWTNYNIKELELHNYNALGDGFINRQAIKRQRKNIVNKFKKLDPHILRAVLGDLKECGII